jgi:hypothetical protein
MQVVMLNKKEKEELVIKLHQENKTIRQIAETVHMSFNDIGSIIRRINGHDNDSCIDTKLSNKSKTTQAIFLFKNGKKPIDAAIELDLPASEIEEILQEYWVLNQLEDLALIYYEIRNHLTLFLKLFHTLKKNKSVNQKNIGRMLRYAVYDLPSLENKIQRLTSDMIDLEWNKKQSRDEVAILNSSIVQLKKSLNWYKMEIEHKKEIISNLNRQRPKDLCIRRKTNWKRSI